MDAHYADDLALLANAPTLAESLLFILEQEAKPIDSYKTIYLFQIRWNQLCIQWKVSKIS